VLQVCHALVSYAAAGSWLMTAAPALLTTSSWESVPPEQPIAPMMTPRSTKGMPFRSRRYQSRRERKEQLDDGVGNTLVLVFRIAR
jgi:hypothetical protein